MTRSVTRRVQLGGVLIAVALITSACGASPGSSVAPASVAPASVTPASVAPTSVALKQATLRLDWTWLVNHVPFRYAKDKGYYAAEGIDLEILEGQGSGSTIQLVGNKKNTFGFADTGTTLINISKGVPVKVVEVIQRQSGFSTSCFKSAGVHKAKDLEGKSVLLIPEESNAAIWPAYLEINGVDAKKVRVINTNFAAKIRLLAEHKADCMAGNVGQDALLAQLLNPEIADPLPWINEGVLLMNYGVIVNRETTTSDPDVIRGFLRATNKAFREICADPTTGVEYYLKAFPDLSAADQEYSRRSLPLLCDFNNPRKGSPGTAYGPTSDADWQPMIDLLAKYGGLQNPQGPATYSTNEFIPEG